MIKNLELKKFFGLKIILLLSLFIVNFRFPLFAYLKLYEWSRFSLFLPIFIILLSMALKGKLSISFKNFGPEKMLLLLGLFLGTIFSLNQVISYGANLTQDILPRFSSTIYFLLFPILLLEENSLDDNDLESILETIGILTIFIGGSFFIFWRFDLVLNTFSIGFNFPTPDYLRRAILPDFLVNVHGSSYQYSSVRTTGHLVNLENSVSVISAFCNFFLFKSLLCLVNKKFKNALIYIAIFLYGLVSILKSSSIWVLAITCFIIALMALYYLAVKVREIVWPSIFIGGGIILLNYLIIDSPTYNRIWHYVFNFKEKSSSFIPILSGCHWEDLIWSFKITPQTPACTFKEWHFFAFPNENGFLNSLGWFYLAIIPIIYFIKIVHIPKSKIPILAFSLTFMFCSLHYPAFQAWGNNYLYIIGILPLMMIRKNFHLEISGRALQN